jgi:hypothetical protein
MAKHVELQQIVFKTATFLSMPHGKIAREEH